MVLKEIFLYIINSRVVPKPSSAHIFYEEIDRKEGIYGYKNNKDRHNGHYSGHKIIINLAIGYEVKPQSTDTWLGLPPIFIL